MSFFTKEAFDVLEEFSVNNTKEWFAENKSRYEATVRKPFANLLLGMSEDLAATDLPYSGGDSPRTSLPTAPTFLGFSRPVEQSLKRVRCSTSI